MKNMKRMLSMMLVIVLTLSLCMPIIHANNSGIKVMLNGEYMNFDVEPQIINGRTMVPFRAIFEAMGAKVQWNQELWQATGEKDGKIVKMIIDNNDVTVTQNGQDKILTMDQAPIVIDGRTMVPVRFVAEAFDKIVTWDNDAQTVIILDLDYFVQLVQQKAPNFYECISNGYMIPETFKSKDEIEFGMDARSEDESIALDINGQIDSIVNKTDAHINMNVQVNSKSIDENAKYSVNGDIFLKDSNIIIKSNVLEILGNDEMEYNDKVYSLKDNGILMNIKDLGIPGINTFEDIMNMYNIETNKVDYISNTINESLKDVNITVKDVKNFIKMFDLTLELVSDDKFDKREDIDRTVYTWEINKEDITNFTLKLITNKIISIEEVDLEDLKELNDLIKDFNMIMEMQIQNNYPIYSKVETSFEMADQDVTIEFTMNYIQKVTDINKGPFNIEHPNIDKALNLKDYMEYINDVQQEAVDRYKEATLQDAVTLFILKKTSMVIESEEEMSVEEVVELMYEDSTWKVTNSDLGIYGIILTDYKLSPTGVVSKI